jgi:hypothetical protein
MADHPVRTIFIETVARRLEISIEAAADLCENYSTSDLDERWPLAEIVEKFENK